MVKNTDFTALLLVRKQAFMDWLRLADRQSGSNDLHDFENDYGVYLIPSEAHGLKVAEYVKDHYLKIFENELSEWHESEFWPEDLTFDLFGEFFDVQMHRQVYTMG